MKIAYNYRINHFNRRDGVSFTQEEAKLEPRFSILCMDCSNHGFILRGERKGKRYCTRKKETNLMKNGLIPSEVSQKERVGKKSSF